MWGLDVVWMTPYALTRSRGGYRGCRNYPPSPMWVAHGYHRFPLSRPAVGRNYSFACCACLQGFYIPSFCLPGSFNFIFPKFLQSSTVECVLSTESECVLVVGIQFVSPWYDPSRLTGRKTSSISLSLYIYIYIYLSLTRLLHNPGHRAN